MRFQKKKTVTPSSTHNVIVSGQISPSNSEAPTAVITTLRRNNNNNNNVNLTHNNNRQNTFNRTLEMNRNNANPLAIGSTGTLPGTLTLGRIKADRNNYQNGYVCGV